jgi:23S rRNA pseudouridine1911/1915/1917 synthase
MIENINNTTTLTVGPESTGERIDVFLANSIPGISRSQLQKLISDGLVKINGRNVTKKEKVSEGISVTVRCIDRNQLEKLEPQEIPLEVIYEDNFFIAVNKPAGLVVHPGNGNKNNTLVNALLFRSENLSSGFAENRPGIVHRLDKDTTGVVIAAKTNPAHFALAKAFQNRTIEKHYIGLCIGIPHSDHSSINLALDRSRRDPLKRAVTEQGKPSCTEYWLLGQRAGISAMHFRPLTGRTHQIRVHCSSAGFPIVADTLYGGNRERLQRINPVERPSAYAIFKCFSRHALHAMALKFRHPFTGKEVFINAPVPDDFWKAAVFFGNRDIFKLNF